MYLGIESATEFAAQASKLVSRDDEHLLIFLAKASEPHLDAVIAGLDAAKVSFFGGIFPGLILGTEVMDAGAIVRPVRVQGQPAIAALADGKVTWVNALPEDVQTSNTPTCLIISDFSCLAVDNLLEEMFNRHASDINYFGAGAGMGVREPQPVVFTNQGRFAGSAVLAYLDMEMEVDLRHGWSRLSDPIVANRTSGNTLNELDWVPAMDVYRDIVGASVAESLNQKQDVPRAKCFPFGIAREGLEDVIRDPIMAIEDQDLVVLSNVPENAVLHVMEGRPDELISAAARLGGAFAQSNRKRECLLFDCFSRAKLLGERFTEELQSFDTELRMRVGPCETEGVLALGEIASDGMRLPDFHNKTMAAALIDAN